MSVESNHRKIRASAGREIDHALNHELPAIVGTPGNAEYKMRRVIAIADRTARLIGPHTPCRRGCASCCHMATTISSIEAAQIGKAIGRTPKPGRPPLDVAETRKAEIDKWHLTPCTFLGLENECTIYDVRPLACRIHHSIEDTPEPCDISRGVRGVHAINLQWLNHAAAIALREESFGDIREFFPPETFGPGLR